MPAILITLTVNGNMATLTRMLNNDEELYNIGINYPHEQIQDFFLHHYKSKDYDLTKRALISKINYVLNDTSLYNMMSGTGVDIEQCLEEGKIIVVNASLTNPFAADIVGRMMIAYVFSVLLRRLSKSKDRVPCYMVIDELSNYAGNGTTLNDMLRQSRKLGCRMILCGQSLKGLPTSLKDACLTNTYLKMVSITDSHSKALMSAEMNISKDELNTIEPMMFMVSRNDGAKTKPFRVKVPILPRSAFLSTKQIHERLAYQIQHTKAYSPIPPPPPAPPLPTKQESKSTVKSKKEINTNDFGTAPAFTD